MCLSSLLVSTSNPLSDIALSDTKLTSNNTQTRLDHTTSHHATKTVFRSAVLRTHSSLDAMFPAFRVSQEVVEGVGQQEGGHSSRGP